MKKTKASKSPAKKSGAKRGSSGKKLSPQVQALVKAGVLLPNPEIHLSDEERAVVDGLSEEELATMVKVYKRFAAADHRFPGPIWRAFCF